VIRNKYNLPLGDFPNIVRFRNALAKYESTLRWTFVLFLLACLLRFDFVVGVLTVRKCACKKESR
jgi:hypothetical protein